jgi:hypothetical protein
VRNYRLFTTKNNKMPIFNLSSQTVTNGGGTVTFPVAQIPDFIQLNPSGGSVALGADYNLATSAHPPVGTSFIVSWGTYIDLNGNNVNIFGTPLVQWQLVNPGYMQFTSINATDYSYSYYPYDFATSSVFDGDAIIPQSIVLDKLEAGSSAQIIVCNGSGSPIYKTVSGDATISTTGYVTISAGAIDDSKVDAAAAIDRSKLANGTADHVVINSGAGAFSSEAQLATERGGTGQDTSADTGFATVSAGTWSVGAISEVITLLVSFEAAGGTTPSVGDFKIMMPYAGTVTQIYSYAVKAIAGTDNGTIVAKNNAGTTMTSGTITYTASDARGTAYSVTPSASNTFAAGDLLTFTTAKTTAGGLVQLSIMVTRTS